jgi:L-ribulose-5-phosphate 3-epimerase
MHPGILPEIRSGVEGLSAHPILKPESREVMGNIAYYTPGDNPCDVLERVEHLVENVHVRNNRESFECGCFPAVGDGGRVDFRRVRKILDGVGYAGAYTIEIEGIGGGPEPGLEGRQERVRRSVEHLRSCGYFD